MWSENAALSDASILAIWEQGRRRHRAEIAGVILALAWPDQDWDTITHLPIGARDAKVLRLRGATIGSNFMMEFSCSNCGEAMEFEATMEELLKDAPTVQEVPVDLPDGPVVFRLPNSLDLGQAARCGTQRAAAEMIAQRCLVSGALASPIPQETLDAISEAMRSADPQSAIAFVLNCPACNTHQRVLFDTGPYVFRELCDMARIILDDVLEIAQAYGWSEAEILAIPAARRKHYLSRIPAR